MEKHTEPAADDKTSEGVSAGPLEFSMCDDDSDDNTSVASWEDFGDELVSPFFFAEFLAAEGSPGPAVSSAGAVDVKDFIKQGGHEVILHIYDVSQEDSIRRVNKVLAHKMSPVKFGGVFHAGVEVLGLEWSYGFSEVETQAGVSCVEPKK